MSTLLQWNARSIVSNLSELQRFLSQQALLPDVICIQESWLNKMVTNFKVDGYHIERVDRDPGLGGGLATFIRAGISYVRLPNPTALEALVIQVKFKTTNVTIVNTYHSPNAPLEEEQYRLLFQNYSRISVEMPSFSGI